LTIILKSSKKHGENRVKKEARQINRHINGLRTIVSVGGALVKSHFDKTRGSGRQIMCAEGIRKG